VANNQQKMKINKLILMTLSGAALLAIAPLATAETPDGAAACFHHGGPMNMTAMLAHVLNLTDAQKAQVQPLIDAAQPQLKAIHEQARAAAEPIMKQLHTQIRPFLTAEQQKKLDALETLHGSAGPE
jgi:Spy/CpxP family protein refolding chaperone